MLFVAASNYSAIAICFERRSLLLFLTHWTSAENGFSKATIQ